MMIEEAQMLDAVENAKKIVLLEPPYKTKYPPLGLAKIETYAKARGVQTVYQRRYAPAGEDLICATSLFTYDQDDVLEEVRKVRFFGGGVPLVLGGVYASLMAKHAEAALPENGALFKGYSKTLDQQPPDWDAHDCWGIDEKWRSWSFVFTSRGCPNKCGYCSVWRIEPGIWAVPNWKEHVDPRRPNLMISDNNLSALPADHLEDVVRFCADMKKKVVFDNGFDVKRITPDMARTLSSIQFAPSGMRVAFDRIEEDGIFQRAVEHLKKAGLKKGTLFAYVLFNFNDTPAEAIYRMEECIRLGVRPYPQCYTPLNSTTRKDKFTGRHWTPNLKNAFRFFYLMAGYYGKHKFRDWARMLRDGWQEARPAKGDDVFRVPTHGNPPSGNEVPKFKLTDEDLAAIGEPWIKRAAS